MDFYMPTHVYSEKDCIKEHADVIATYGKRAFIITGRNSSKKNHSLADLTEALETVGVSYTIFDDIEENPSIETVMKARQIGIENKVDMVIGLGGGSPMDAAKAISLMIANPDKDDRVLYESIELSYLPVIEIPTTAGTGSEVTPWSILTIHAKRTKSSISHRIYPAVALIDSKYLRSVPRRSLVSTTVDTLAHLVESYLVTKATRYSRTFSRRGLELWGSFMNDLLNDTLTDEDYENIMEACTLGGIAITHTGTGLPHALSYKITYETGAAHGLACGYTLGGFLKCYEDKALVKEVTTALGLEDSEAFCKYLDQLIGRPELEDELWRADVEEIVNKPAKMASYPFTISADEMYGFI